jgi:hypothetical protein
MSIDPPPEPNRASLSWKGFSGSVVEGGRPVSDDEREKILSVLQESAQKRKMTIEIEPDVRRWRPLSA